LETQSWACIGILYGHWKPLVEIVFVPDGKRIISRTYGGIVRIWDISAVIEGREFEIEVDDGTPAVVGSWFRHVIPLGGWFGTVPFVFQHRFKLPAGVEPLGWKIVSEEETEVKISGDKELDSRGAA
jgi:hypothetical protein